VVVGDMQGNRTQPSSLEDGSFRLCEPGLTLSAASTHDGDVRQRILALKYHNDRGQAVYLARLLAPLLHDLHPSPQVITWAPTTSRRIRERGLDQAEWLARALARELGLPCKRLLKRINRDSQEGQNRITRLTRPRFRARVRPNMRCVVVVDDVITTGATLRAAAKGLHAEGVVHVHAVAVSHRRRGRGAHR
jgi:predicted amidophosphoribosyltransferase